MKLSNTNQLKNELEDKHTDLNLDEDFDDHIFEVTPQIHELAIIERIINASEMFDKISQRIQQDYPQNSPPSQFSPIEVSVDESLDDVKHLRLSYMQNQRSWLDRITKPLPRNNKDEIKPEKMEKQQKKYEMQEELIKYLWLFVHKTALPTILKYEQLQEKYSIEKTE